MSHLVALGDSADVCAALPSEVRFDLVYLDPPFGVGTTMTARSARGEARGRRRPESGPDAYDDRASADALVATLAPRLAAIRDRMAEGATLYLHLDHRAVHDAKVACDRLFGRGAFLGEIIWAPGNGGRGARGFSVTHQTILLYARAASERGRVVYNASDPALREPYAETSLAMHFKHRDEDGRLYRERILGGKAYRYYADEGRRLGSVWTDIPGMVANTPLRREATGYPTQKPEKLLERIVRASSAPGATVADLMCGSGTTLVAAARLGRRFVGGDRSQLAFATFRERLDREAIAYSVIEVPGGREADPARAEEA
ncbi:site-specific DNA-methyltransferase [Sorangium sp. So ce119]|uniref:DNA-methyltransferase n=1 Tax=Sorangium sp. So ce119 TaxID=3133279 RepID=UPI003F5F9FC9